MNDHRLVETHPKNRNRYHATTIMTRGMWSDGFGKIVVIL
jgi:hypothetical protein